MLIPQKFECKCGETIELYSAWENQCPHCKRLFNGAGQELRPFEEYADEWMED